MLKPFLKYEEPLKFNQHRYAGVLSGLETLCISFVSDVGFYAIEFADITERHVCFIHGAFLCFSLGVSTFMASY